MPIPLRYNLRSIFYRKTTTILTLLAIALTVCVLVIVLALHQGFLRAAERTGRPDNVICLREASTSEGESSVSLALAQKLMGLPEVDRDKDGTVLAVPEIFAGLYLDRVNHGGTNVSVRGTSPVALKIRDRVKIREGTFFTPGKREIVVGKGLVDRIKGCRLGGVVNVYNQDWSVVGILDGGGSSFDSEIWGDNQQIAQLFDRVGWNSVVFRVAPQYVASLGTAERVEGDGFGSKEDLKNARTIAATGLLARLAAEEFKIKGMSEQEYFAKQSGFMGVMMAGFAGLLAIVMAVGAIVGCTNTLLAAVTGRTREIGALLAIGFRPRDVFLGFLVESLVLGLIGGTAGTLLGSSVHGMATGTFGFATFSESTFQFEITPATVIIALSLAAFIGILGGTVPAIRAARLVPTNAIREG